MFVIKHPSAHLFVIEGKKVEEQCALINITTDQGVAKLLSYLTKIGVDDALKEKGVVSKDTIRIGEFEFEYDE